MRYISYYEEYQIYEPAEGGYYYSGNQLIKSERKSKRACKKDLLHIWEECQKENEEYGFRTDNKDEWDMIIMNTRMHPWIFNREHNYIYKRSHYIGNDKCILIERKQGSETHGWTPYC